ncbi:MAG: bifunctional hydroxymethylpyrimidine kinase/phosphomethylpyrimidine kinase [Alphaproteobacteria bacterium]|nr:bifunctional hydroxymethylpyrimidine kinase/phosphomethylpyrimidine kinase [Alphaproteobacteria bacterium]
MNEPARVHGRVLIVAGSDSGGGAGIQADIKAVTALGGFAATAVTALTAQNTEAVFGVVPVAPDFIAEQMRRVLWDIGADCIKLGMLHDVAVIETVAGILAREVSSIPVVADPVMVAKGGAALLVPAATDSLKRRIVPLAHVLTPNVPEAEALTGRAIHTSDDMIGAARTLLGLGARSVLMKGGHLGGETVRDFLVTAEAVTEIAHPRVHTRHTHGTGCTLASAVATGIAQGLAVEAAVRRAIAYVQVALATAPGFGRGHGPLNHGHTVRPFSG